MEFRLRGFAEKTLKRLRPYYTFDGTYRPDRPRKASNEAPRRASTSSADRPRYDTHLQNCDKTDRTNPASENNTTDVEYTTDMENLVTPRVINLPAEVSVEQSEGMEAPHKALPYTEGFSRVLLANDGTKACLALLLTDEIVSKINQISTLDRQVMGLQRKFHDAEGEASRAQIYLDESSDLINVTEEETTKLEETRDKTLKRKQQIGDILTDYENKLVFFRDHLQELFEKALDGAGLFTSKPEEEIAVEVPDDSETQTPGTSEQMSGSTSYTDKTIITVVHLNRLATYEGMQDREEELQKLQDRFDKRKHRYDQDLFDYNQAVEAGDCSLSQSSFDRKYISDVRDLTKALADAEVSLEDANSQARALGLIGNAWEQESNFVNHPDDGSYLESLEAMCGGVNRGIIEAWMTEVPEFQKEEVTDSQDEESTVSQDEEGTVSRDKEGTVSRDKEGTVSRIEVVTVSRDVEDVEDQDGDGWDAETVEYQDGDEWDAKSVKISDSVSAVDRGRNRRRIDRWQERWGHG